MENFLKTTENPESKTDKKEFKIFLVLNTGLHFYRTATDIQNHRSSVSRILIVLLLQNKDVNTQMRTISVVHRKAKYDADQKGVLPIARTIKKVILLLSVPKLHIYKVFSNSSERRNTPAQTLGPPSLRKAMLVETNSRILGSDEWKLSLRTLYQSIFKLDFNISLISPERMVKKLTTKGSAPENNRRGSLSDSTSLMFVVLGWSGDNPAESIEVFDANTQKWSFFESETPFMRAYHGVSLLGGHLYIIGGFNGHSCLASALCVDMRSHQWSRKSSMSTPRCYVITLVHRGQVYAIGGHNGVNRLRSCERFDPKSNKWIRVRDMMYRRSDAAGSEYKGKIIVSGGFDGFQFHSTAEVYDSESDQWTLIGSLIHPRSGHCMVSVDGLLYTLGGFNGTERLREVEKLHEETNRWESSVPMLDRRSNFCSVVYQQEMYVMGGYDGRSTISMVERFNKALMQWQRAPSLNIHRSAAGACVVDNLRSASACALKEFVPVVSTNIEESSP